MRRVEAWRTSSRSGELLDLSRREIQLWIQLRQAERDAQPLGPRPDLHGAVTPAQLARIEKLCDRYGLDDAALQQVLLEEAHTQAVEFLDEPAADRVINAILLRAMG